MNSGLSDGWLQRNVHHRPAAAAAYRALRLMQLYVPDSLSSVKPSIWRKWALTILSFNSNEPSPEKAEQANLLHRAYAADQSAVMSAAEAYLKVMGNAGLRDIVSIVRNWVDEPMLEFLWKRWRVLTANTDSEIGDSSLERLFAEKDFKQFERFFSAELESVTSAVESTKQFVIAASAMFDAHPDRAAVWLILLARREPAVASDVVSRAAEPWGTATQTFIANLAPNDAVFFYSFCRTHFPPPPNEEGGAHFITPRHNVEQIRQRLIAQLSERGTERCVLALPAIRDQNRDQSAPLQFIRRASDKERWETSQLACSSRSYWAH